MGAGIVWSYVRNAVSGAGTGNREEEHQHGTLPVPNAATTIHAYRASYLTFRTFRLSSFLTTSSPAVWGLTSESKSRILPSGPM